MILLLGNRATGQFMIELTPKQQIFIQDDVSTRLHHLAAHLEQIQSLWTQGLSQELILTLVKESRYFIELSGAENFFEF